MTATTSAHRSAMGAVYGMPLGNLAFPVGSLRPWQLAALEKLSSLNGLRANWDSYGSPPISDDVLGIAKKLVGESQSDAPTPRVVAVSGGGVQVEWENGPKVLNFLVRSDHSIEILVDNDAGEPFETTLPSLNAGALTKILSWLVE
jgi:hypothetical protein